MFKTGRIAVVVGLFLLVFAAGAGFAQKSTSTETMNFEVIAVDGNKVVARSAGGTKEYTLPDGFQFNVGGKQLSVHELKPGMKGTATVTTTTTTVPVHVTDVRNGEVIKAEASTVIIRGEKGGYQMFNQGDADKRKVQIVRDGKVVKISDLRVGDRLSATLITEGTPQVLTEREVQATIAQGSTAAPAKAAPKESAASSSSATSSMASTETTDTASSSQTLPPTASSLPLVGLIGMVSLAIAFALRSRRLRG